MELCDLTYCPGAAGDLFVQMSAPLLGVLLLLACLGPKPNRSYPAAASAAFFLSFIMLFAAVAQLLGEQKGLLGLGALGCLSLSLTIWLARGGEEGGGGDGGEEPESPGDPPPPEFDFELFREQLEKYRQENERAGANLPGGSESKWCEVRRLADRDA